MPIKKGSIHELTIMDLAFGGKGFAKIDGYVVFVEQAVPGDVVIVRVVRKKNNYAKARIIEMIRPSPLRTDPLCPYSGVCGGCNWQFLPYELQLEYKQRHVKEVLEHIGDIHNIQVNPTLPSPRVFEYRNKMEFSCSDRKWLIYIIIFLDHWHNLDIHHLMNLLIMVKGEDLQLLLEIQPHMAPQYPNWFLAGNILLGYRPQKHFCSFLKIILKKQF